MEYDIYVDYNNVGEGWTYWAPWTHVKETNYSPPWTGRIVVTGDDEGNICYAWVRSTTDKGVELQLDQDSWRHEHDA